MLTKSHVNTLRKSAPAKQRLGLAIKLAGITQHQVALGVKCPDSYVSDLVNGRYGTVTLTTAWKLADFFQCRIEDLFPNPGEVQRYTKKEFEALDRSYLSLSQEFRAAEGYDN